MTQAPEAHRASQRRYYWANRERLADRAKQPDYLERHRGYEATNRLRNAEKIAARNAVTHALERAELVRQPCVECGAAPGLAHHGNGYGEAHWLDVEWLCAVHHGLRHRAD